MITIYCLVDSRDNKPFYVGATQSLLKIRLQGHFFDANFYRAYVKDSIVIRKSKLINEIRDNGYEVHIRPLQLVNEFSVNYYEHFYYTLFIKQGYTPLQSKGHFKYREQMKYNIPITNENQQLREHLKILSKF
jgi:hypothetical protein